MICNFLSEATTHVVLRLFPSGIAENLGSIVILDQLAEIKECRAIRDAGRLLHVVGHDDDGVLKAKAREKYADKYDDLDFLDDFNSNDDNDLGETEELTDDLGDEIADEPVEDFDD